MEYVLVALMQMSTPSGTYYSFETMAEYRTMEECDRSLRRAVKNGTTKMVSLICTKRDWDYEIHSYDINAVLWSSTR